MRIRLAVILGLAVIERARPIHRADQFTASARRDDVYRLMSDRDLLAQVEAAELIDHLPFGRNATRILAWRGRCTARLCARQRRASMSVQRGNPTVPGQPEASTGRALVCRENVPDGSVDCRCATWLGCDKCAETPEHKINPRDGRGKLWCCHFSEKLAQ